MYTVGELKQFIKDLPDDMLLVGYHGSGYPLPIGCWIVSEDTLTEEEIEDGYPDGVTPTLVISTD